MLKSALSVASDDVPALPEGWSEAFDPARCRPFYVSGATGHAQWERPLYPACEVPSVSGGPQQAASATSEHGEDGAMKKVADDASHSKEPSAQTPTTGVAVATSSVVAVSQPADVSDAEGGGRNALVTHLQPSHERKAGRLCVGHCSPDQPAPAAKARALGERWCILEDGELYVLPTPESPASELVLKLGLVGVRGVSCPTELQAGCPHSLFLELSPEPRSREGWLGMGRCTQLVLVAASAEEQQTWQTTLQRVATAYRNWRRVSESPGMVLGGLKSVGNFALHAAGSGLGWQVGRDAGAGVSRAIGLR